MNTARTACRIGGSGLDHAIFFGNIHFYILDQREFDFDVFHALVLDPIFDGPQPCDVSKEAVDRKANQFSVQRFELICHRCKRHKFGGADGCEVGRMAEQNHPFFFKVLWEVNFPLCSFWP